MSGPLSDKPQQERERLAKLLAATAVSEVPNVARSIATDNKTVFGAILRGELPARVLYEDDDVLCFRDIRPVSEHHSLVIPKLRLIENVGHCSADDQALLEHMVAVAEKVVAAQYPGVDMQSAKSSNALSLGFHRWPMLSVGHLHLHCIYPMPCTKFWHRWLHPQNYGPLYVPASREIARLQEQSEGPTRDDGSGCGIM